MNADLKYIEQDNYMVIECSGLHDNEEFKSCINNVFCECERNKTTKVLIDVTKIEYPPKEIEKYMMGKYIALVWGQKIKGVLLTKPETRTQLIEDVVVNRGTSFKVYSCKKEAPAWLL